MTPDEYKRYRESSKPKAEMKTKTKAKAEKKEETNVEKGDKK